MKDLWSPKCRNCAVSMYNILFQELKGFYWAAPVTCNYFLRWEEQGGHSHTSSAAISALTWERHRIILRSKAAIFSSILLAPFIACLGEVNKIWYIYIENSFGKVRISQLQMLEVDMMLHISGLLHMQGSICLQSQRCFSPQIIRFILFSLQQCGSQMCFPVFRL